MALALSTRWLREGGDRLGLGAEAARRMGFAAVHAARPPKDASAAKAVIDRLGLALSGVEAEPALEASAVPALVAQAAEAAALLKRPLVIADLGALTLAARETPEAGVLRLSRTIHGVLSRWPGLALAIRTAGLPGRLLDHRETEWLLADHAGKPLGLWQDPVRALALERARPGPSVLDWADRFAPRTLGISVHGLGSGRGHARPGEDGLDWGTLRGLLPTLAPRVLDLDPSVGPDEVVEVRRRFEEGLGW